MKYNYLTALLLIICCATSCVEEEEEQQCDYERLYPEVPEVQFTVNGTNYIQNVSSASFPDSDNNFEKIYIEGTPSGGTTNIELYFTFIEFINDESCAAEYEHRIFLDINVDQGSNETKTYPVNLLGTAATGSYVFEKESPQFPSGSSSITINKYVPENELEGFFDIQFGDNSTTGTFKLDLRKDY